MKKRSWAVFLPVFLLAISSVGWAQENSKFSLAPGAGVSLPLGNFADAYNLGFNLGATLNVNLAGNFYLFGDLRYSFFSPDTKGWGYPANATISGGQESIFSIFAGGKYLFPMQGKVKVYGLAGLGLCMVSTSDLTADYTIVTSWYKATVHEEISFNNSAADFGLLFGGGLVYKLKPHLDLFGEIRFVNIFTEGESTQMMPIIIGVLIRL